MSFLRYLMLLSLIVWLGGIIYFSFVVAPTVFAVLPTRHLAGNVVARSLTALHWMGIVSGLVFVMCSMIVTRASTGAAEPLAVRHILVYLMLALTAISQFIIFPKMMAIRNSLGEIDSILLTDPARVLFDSLHVWSTRLEVGVFVLGLALVFLVAQAIRP
ncbi:MAG TPA: DUF4149 domain-containing protein [Terriglobales bacterium]|jgi:hypothetical protein